MRRPASTRSEPRPEPTADLRIARVGAEGDGIGTLTDGRTAYVPLTLPGERVLARVEQRRGDGWAAALEAVVEVSADRIPAPCPHFGPCGGCGLQHWGDAPYAAWKAARLAEALSRAGFTDPPVATLHRTLPGTRRRMDLAIRRTGSVVGVGLHQRRSLEIVDIAGCLVLHPALLALLAALRDTLPALSALRREGSAVVNLLESGPDLLLRTDDALTSGDRTVLAALAERQHLPRITWARGNGAPEVACQLRPAVTRLSGVLVAPPPGAFLQASEAGETAIRDAVLAALPDRLSGRRRVIELFAGCGTLSFPLAARGRVRAFEGDAPAAAALRRAGEGSGRQ